MATLFVDNLTVIDFSYLHHERGIVGDSWQVDIELSGALDEQGMVFDFGEVKRQIKHIIDQETDHRLWVPTKALGYSAKLNNSQLALTFALLSGGVIHHQSPVDAVLLLDVENIQKGQVASFLQQKIQAVLPKNVTEVRIFLRSEVIQGAFYHYTHGLQKHAGQCQRIAHGHRSRIQITVDNQRQADIEAHWASRLNDAYIATQAHIRKTCLVSNISHTELGYKAAQGEFFIRLPTDRVFVMEAETTVENIAAELAQLSAKQYRQSVLVRAYEGIGKGALATGLYTHD